MLLALEMRSRGLCCWRFQGFHGKIHGSCIRLTSSSSWTLRRQQEEAPPALVKLEQVYLAYPSWWSPSPSASSSSSDSDDTSRRRSNFTMGPINLTIHRPSSKIRRGSSSSSDFFAGDTPADGAGYAWLGPNGVGKSLLALALCHPDKYVQGGSITWGRSPLSDRPVSVQYVSFTAHDDLLRQSQEHHHHPPTTDEDGQPPKMPRPLTVSKVLAAATPAGNLNQTAQFLIVRLGLYPLLHRLLPTLSTGEIRKVLLVRALIAQPDLLVLDNALDGLDVPSRQALNEIIIKTMQGFRPDILIQGVSSRHTARTVVVLMTHRTEEIVPPVHTLSYFRRVLMPPDHTMQDSSSRPQWVWTTEPRHGRTGTSLMATALNLPLPPLQHVESNWTWDVWSADNQDSSDAEGAWGTLPNLDQVRRLWWKGRAKDSLCPTSESKKQPLVVADRLLVEKGDSALLHYLSWTVLTGQHWLVAGGNGAGKSTLSRLLARHEDGITDGFLTVLPSCVTEELAQKPHSSQRRSGVGWVSTELHMSFARSRLSAKTIMEAYFQEQKRADSCWEDVWELSQSIAAWLEIPETLLDERPFSAWSQGEQKLILVTVALANRPRVLVLDEPCQGLDVRRRRLLLRLVEMFCRAARSEMSLVYITHHLEELLPSVTHVLHLQKGHVVFQGYKDDYSPEDCDA